MFASRRAERAVPVWLWPVLWAVLVVADRLTKTAVAANMTEGEDIPVLGPLLHLFYLRNTGAAFSMLDSLSFGRWLLVGVTLVLIGVCIWALFSGKVRPLMGRIALSMIIGGGLGNLIDRIATGRVIDFLYFQFIHFAVFNLADSFVVIGAILFCLSLFLSRETARP